jgi:hypothetical protein
MRHILPAMLLLSTPALAELPVGGRPISLRSSTETIEIGTVDFQGSGESRKITVMLKDGLFKDHFLSMRPFKCLEGPKFYCHLPYPYDWRGEVSETDLTDLEYALLFVQKEPTAYGINLWHGIYYRMALGADGRISGTLHEVDMDALASPPAAGDLRPLTLDMLNAADPASQWLPEILIE